MQLEAPLATPQPNLWQDDGINRATCQTFCRKSGFRTGYDSNFHKNVTYLLHGGAVGVRIKRRKRVKIGQTIRFGSDDF